MSRIMSHAGPTVVSRAARWLSGALLVPSLAAAQADTRPVVVVFTFTNSSIGPAKAEFDGIATGIQDLLITDLASSSKMRLVDRSRVRLGSRERRDEQRAAQPTRGARNDRRPGVRHDSRHGSLLGQY